ncbi:hypothetical protein [Colwellia sp. BRX10-4]|jgi:hypothetical protein|uniref:hypothetical protein n=1 Tax=Colwellia sp. BRX10-4 TaxID=2759843 RepID=UPI0015F72860|nr:hypothetical protein [Colwellia sp. BRX10-4]MBA6397670.1 hypothetical protein [Colwellia sp. BRX10-4]
MDKKFCVLCWRPRNTKYFCLEHLGSGKTRKLQQRHKRRLLSVLEEKVLCIIPTLEKPNYYSFLYECAYKLSVKPAVAIQGASYPSLGIRNQSKVIWGIASRYYPISYNKLNLLNIDLFMNKHELVGAIVQVLEDCDDVSSIKSSYTALSIDLDAQVWIPNVVELLARHESFMAVNEVSVKPGPRQRTNEDKKLREKLVARINTFNSKGQEYTLAQLGNEFNLSPARVCVLRKQLIKRKLIE